MLAFEPNKAAVVAHDTQTAFSQYDDAYRSALRLASSFLDVAEKSNLSAREQQKLMQVVHDSAGDLLAGRSKMVTATAILTQFHHNSNLAETSFGCPGPGPWMDNDKAALQAVA
ncbi:hypothetical protein LL251_08635 [Sphingobium naphthae]|nr:hypothetical protein [Sphingobium naphthae]